MALAQELERVLTLLAPGIELVRLEAFLPRLLPPLPLAREPIGATQLVVGLDQVRPELERLLQKRLRVFVHLPLQVDQAEVEVGVQRRLLVVVETDRFGEMLDRLLQDTVVVTDVPYVDSCKP